MTKVACWNFLTVLSVYCFILPDEVVSLQQRKLKLLNKNEMSMFSNLLLGNVRNDYSNGIKDFKKLLKPLLVPRMPDTDSNRQVQQYIRNHFTRLNWNVEDDTFVDNTPYGPKQFTNIIATFDPTAKNKLVLACHFDSKNISDSKGNYFIAATDSAVPCALIMDLVEKLDCALQHERKNRKRSPEDAVTLQVMFFDGEEAYKDWTATDSIYGSRHLAELWSRTPDPNFPQNTRLQNIELFILLDLIGSSDVVFKNFYPNTEYYFGQLIKIEETLKKYQTEDMFNRKGLKEEGSNVEKILFSKNRPWGGIEDDHKPFLFHRSDLPVLHLISSPFPRVWHQMSDNEGAINYDVTDNVGRVLRVFVAGYMRLTNQQCRK